MQATVQFAAMAAVIVTGHREPWLFVATWGLGSYVAAAVSGAALSVAPDLRSAPAPGSASTGTSRVSTASTT